MTVAVTVVAVAFPVNETVGSAVVYVPPLRPVIPVTLPVAVPVALPENVTAGGKAVVYDPPLRPVTPLTLPVGVPTAVVPPAGAAANVTLGSAV